jgi:hypothetical protein
VTRRTTATMVAGGTPAPPRSFAGYADTPPEETLAC